jgi:aspartate aminotransferase
MDFAMYLMESAGVAVVPGSGFLADGFIRISYAASEDDLTRAIAAIHAAVVQLTEATS